MTKAKVETNNGTFTIEFFDDQTPNTVKNIVSLAQSGFNQVSIMELNSIELYQILLFKEEILQEQVEVDLDTKSLMR